MVKYETIIKIIEHEISKCPVAIPLKRLGSTGVWTEGTDEYGEPTRTITYEDGTSITFSMSRIQKNEILSVSDSEGFNSDYGGTQASNFYYQEDDIIDKFGYEGYEFFKEYTHYKASGIGMVYNKYLRGEITKKEAIEKAKEIYPKPYIPADPDFHMFRDKDGEYMMNYLFDNHDKYNEIISEQYTNSEFVTVRGVNDQFGTGDKEAWDKFLSRKITSDKGYTSASIGMDIGGTGQAIDIKDTHWKIITKHRFGNGKNNGAYLGDANYENWGFDDWQEFLYPPYEKFRRTHIDMENHIIIQEPY